MINAIQIALSGLTGASRRVDAAASNIANATTGGALDEADGPAPYRPLTAQQTAITGADGKPAGVRTDIVPSGKPFVQAYAPDSPFANRDGLIGAPDIDLAEEIVNLKVAASTYEANLKVIQVSAGLQDELLRHFDKKS